MKSVQRRPSDRPDGEHGFVLLAAIWLLVLAGSIAAFLLLRAFAVANEARGEADALSRKLAIKAAVESVIASRMFEGQHSRWWTTPAQQTLRIGPHDVEIHLTSESGRLDVNEMSLDTLDAGLRGLGVAAVERRKLAEALGERRKAGHPITSLIELRTILPIDGANGVCLRNYLTTASGRAQPRADQLPAELARALGVAASGVEARGEVEPGAALRLEVSTGGLEVLTVVRIAGALNQPIATQIWETPLSCVSPDRVEHR